jgi:type IV pilus assembly protein PilM
MVMNNVRATERAGLRVVGVDLTPFAVLRALGEFGAAADGTVALVDVGAKVTNIVVHQAGVPLFVRILLMGGQDVPDAVADRRGMSHSQAEALNQHPDSTGYGHDDLVNAGRAVETTAAALVDEIRGSLDYFTSSSPAGRVERLILTGGGSRLTGLGERLEASTRVPVTRGNPLQGLRVGNTGLSSDQVDFVQPLATVPVGLALGADR